MAIPFLSNISGKSATLSGTLSLGGGDSTTAQLALKGQQSLLSFIRGTSGDAQFFMSSDSARLYFSHTDIQSTNLILTLNTDKSATFAGLVTVGPGTTGSPYDATTFLHVKGTTRSIVQQSSTADAYYMFGDAAANNVAWLGYNHSTNQLSLHTSGTTYIDGNTTFAGNLGTGGLTATDVTGS